MRLIQIRSHFGIALLIAITLSLLIVVPALGEQNPATASPTSFPPFPPMPSMPQAKPRDGGPLKIVATTPIIADLVRQIGGERVDVDSLLPNNADPHEFEPAPQDLVKLARADAIFVHGLHLDAWSQQLIKHSDTKAPVFVATEGVKTLASDEDEFKQGDPHVWFDPIRVKTMVGDIAADLSKIDPDGASSYDQRLAAYRSSLDQLDREIAARIALIPPDQRKLVTNHDALRYYAERYGLTIVGTIIPGMDTQAEPSARDIGALVKKIKDEHVKAIFAENTVSPKLAKQLATQAGVAVVDDLYTDSLGGPDSGADTYIGLMETDTRLIVEALR